MYLDQLLDPIVLSLLAAGLLAMFVHQINRWWAIRDEMPFGEFITSYAGYTAAAVLAFVLTAVPMIEVQVGAIIEMRDAGERIRVSQVLVVLFSVVSAGWNVDSVLNKTPGRSSWLEPIVGLVAKGKASA